MYVPRFFGRVSLTLHLRAAVKDGIDNAASSVGDAAKGAIDGVKDAADGAFLLPRT
jgi:hypothetical protein